MDAITTLAITKERGERMRDLHPQEFTSTAKEEGEEEIRMLHRVTHVTKRVLVTVLHNWPNSLT